MHSHALRSLAVFAIALLIAALVPGRTGVRATDLPYRLFVPMVAADTAPGPTIEVVSYFFMSEIDGTGGPFLVPVHREVPETVGVARAAIQALLDGPTAGEMSSTPAISSAVPAGTELLDIAISDGVATVDLSSEFESGGGSLSIRGRLAQLVFTLTRFSTVDSVVLQIEGVQVEVFSAEGLVIDAPMVRDDFMDLAPPILVETPVYGGEAGNPLRVTGFANVFEAAFTVTLVDGDGLILAEEQVMATCGTGCWGTFDVTIPYSVANRQRGAIIAWVASAQDGSQVEIREYPVWLNP